LLFVGFFVLTDFVHQLEEKRKKESALILKSAFENRLRAGLV